MQLIGYLLSNFYLNMFRAPLCPSSGEQDRVLLHMVFCTGCVELGRKLCALCEGYCSNSNLHTVHTAYDPAPHNHSQHKQCRTPYAVVHGLVLLMMGIIVPETCWDRSLIINTRLVASCLFLSLHPKWKKSFRGTPLLDLTIKHCTMLAGGPHLMLFSASWIQFTLPFLSFHFVTCPRSLNGFLFSFLRFCEHNFYEFLIYPMHADNTRMPFVDQTGIKTSSSHMRCNTLITRQALRLT